MVTCGMGGNGGVIYLLCGRGAQQERDVSHLGGASLVGLPSACLLRHRAALQGRGSGLQPSAVCGQRHSLTGLTHLRDEATAHQRKRRALYCATNPPT